MTCLFQAMTAMKQNPLFFATLLLATLPACSNKPETVAAAAKPRTLTATKVDTNSSDASTFPKSVFTVNPKDGRDPFFPSRRAVAAVTPAVDGKSEAPKADMASSLNLQGIVSGSAFLNDTVISAGRTSEITIITDGHPQKVKIRCLKVTRNTVELSMEGHPGTIVLRVGKP